MGANVKNLVYSLIIYVIVCNYCCACDQEGMIKDIVDRVAGGSALLNDSMTSIRKVMTDSIAVGMKVANRLATTSNVPGVYDMVKNGSTLGINVLSGLVRVDRVREPGKPRALSVRVFGVPVFNRGFDLNAIKPTGRGTGPEPEADAGGRDNGSGGSGEEEELPIDP